MIEERPLGPPTIQTRPAHAYPSMMPDMFNFVCENQGLKNWIVKSLTRPEVACPAEGLVEFKGCQVLDAKFVFDASGLLISETARDAEAGKVGARRALAAEAAEARRLVDNAAPFVIVFKEGGANYGHVLTEMLPKLMMLSGHAAPLNILVPDEATWSLPLFTLVADILGLEVNFVISQQPLLLVDQLIVCSPVSKHNTQKSETTNALVQLIIDHVVRDISMSGADRIYVSRSSDAKRRISNGAQIEEYFEGLGYRIVDPGKLSFGEQVAAFAKAQHVVGALGAGLSNIVFSPRGAKIFMIDPGLYDFFFWDIACLRRQRFSWFFNRPLDMFDADMLSTPYEVREASLQAAITIANFE